MAKHFEFIGIPGSGKTTLKDYLIDQLNKRKLNVFSVESALINSNREKLKTVNTSKFKYLVKYFIYMLVTNKFSSIFRYSNFQVSAYNKFVKSNPRLANLIFEVLTNQEIEEVKKEYIMYLIFSNFSSHQMINDNANNNEVIINDEGFCHRAVAIWGRDKNYNFCKKEIHNYLDLIPLPDIIFVINTGVKQCEKRLNNRGYPTILKSLEYEERVKRLYFIREIINYIVSLLEEKGVKIVYLDNMSEGCIFIPNEVIDNIAERYKST
ncbi:MAG: hypothetical protein ACLFMO_05495 [Eubacteriales bacterium]